MAPASAPQSDPAHDTRTARWKEKVHTVRAWIAAHPKYSVLAAGGAFTVFTTVLMLWVTLNVASRHAEQVTLEMAFEAFDSRAFIQLNDLLDQLRQQPTQSTEQLAALAFLRGASLAYEIDETWAKDKTASYLLAAKYLDEARSRGWPTDRSAEGLWLLGRSLFYSQQYPQCRVALLEALPLNPERKTDIERMLAAAFLHDANPKFNEALEYNTRYLSDKRLPKAARHEGQLERAQILFRLKRFDDCRGALSEIPHESPLYGEVLLTRGRLVMQQAQAINKPQEDSQPPATGAASSENLKAALPLYQQAIDLFRKAQSHDSLASNTTRKAMYLIGVCYGETGELQAAYDQLERTRKLYFESPEGLAASFAAADMLRQLERHDDAVSAYLNTFQAAGNPETYSNPWITLDEFRLRMNAAYQAYLDMHKYQQALDLLVGFRPMFNKFHTVELTAQTYRIWGDRLLAEAAQQRELDARETRLTAGMYFRRAGHTYARLARMRLATRSFPDDLWNAGECLVAGQDYTTAIRILEEYLKNEQHKRRPQALLSLGKAKLAIGDVEGSIAALTECIDFHNRDAAVYEARFWCSKAQFEAGDAEKAEGLLLTNLTGDTLTPASHEWRNSLFALGQLLHTVGRYPEALRYLEEAVERYPDDQQTIEAYYLIAESYRQAAQTPLARLQEATIESVRIDLQREVGRNLEKAVENYARVKRDLQLLTEQSHLTELEAAMLRNCYFLQAGALFDLGRYEQALKAYSDATTRYQSEPVVLEALVQMAHCYRRLHRPDEARDALEQAKVVWQRLPEDATFTQTTNYQRDEWQQLLDQMSVW